VSLRLSEPVVEIVGTGEIKSSRGELGYVEIDIRVRLEVGSRERDETANHVLSSISAMPIE